MTDWINNHRVFPRLFAIFYLWLTKVVVYWYLALEVPTTEQAGFAVAIVTGSAAYFKFYVESGNNAR